MTSILTDSHTQGTHNRLESHHTLSKNPIKQITNETNIVDAFAEQIGDCVTRLYIL